MTNLPSNTILSVVTAVTILCVAYSSSFVHSVDSNNALAYKRGNGEEQMSVQNISESSSEIKTVLEENKNSSPSFIIFNNQSGLITLGLNSYWADQDIICKTGFQCSNSTSTGWKDSTSFEISTSNNTKNT